MRRTRQNLWSSRVVGAVCLFVLCFQASALAQAPEADLSRIVPEELAALKADSFQTMKAARCAAAYGVSARRAEKQGDESDMFRARENAGYWIATMNAILSEEAAAQRIESQLQYWIGQIEKNGEDKTASLLFAYELICGRLKDKLEGEEF